MPSLPGEYVGPVEELYSPMSSTSPNYGNDFYLSLIPNPAHDIVNINFSIADDAAVSLSLFTVDGRLVKTISNKVQTAAGYYKLPLEVASLENGIYYVRMDCNGKSQTSKLVVVK